jgi:hypothetical protein
MLDLDCDKHISGQIHKNSFTLYSKTSFLVQTKFITEDSEQTHIQILILN